MIIIPFYEESFSVWIFVMHMLIVFTILLYFLGGLMSGNYWGNTLREKSLMCLFTTGMGASLANSLVSLLVIYEHTSR